MGFKARARANQAKTGDDDKKKDVKTGKEPCGVNGCEGWADSTMGGRSLSVTDAEDMWGKSVVVPFGDKEYQNAKKFKIRNIQCKLKRTIKIYFAKVSTENSRHYERQSSIYILFKLIASIKLFWGFENEQKNYLKS